MQIHDVLLLKNILFDRSQSSSSLPYLKLTLDVWQRNVPSYNYGGWWSVWWMGTYSMVLSKAAFFHRKYLDLYTHEMPSSIHDYVSRERYGLKGSFPSNVWDLGINLPLNFKHIFLIFHARNCEDIAMSLLVANATGAPPIWVKGKMFCVLCLLSFYIMIH